MLRRKDNVFAKYGKKALKSFQKPMTIRYVPQQYTETSEPFALEKVNMPWVMGNIDRTYRSCCKQVQQRYRITTNDWCGNTGAYRNAVRAAIFTNYYNLTFQVPKEWGRKWKITVKHNTRGEFMFQPGGHALTNLLNELLGETGYLPDGYLTITITAEQT